MTALMQPEGDYESLIEEYVKGVSSSNDTATLSTSEGSAKAKGRRRSKTSNEQKAENQQTSK